MTTTETLMLSDSEIAAEIADIAKQRRLELNVTQKDFAKQVGMSHISYVEFEASGKTSSLKLIRILRRLNLLGDLMSGLNKHNTIEFLGLEKYYEKQTKKSRSRASSLCGNT